MGHSRFPAVGFTLAVWILAGLAGAGPASVQQSRYYPWRLWEPLFNGTDLSGWVVIGKEKWRVEKGTIVGESGAGGEGFLATQRSFTDFELHLKFKVETPTNSGLFYHTTFEGEEFVSGMQVEIDQRINRHTGGLHEPRGRGWVVWPAPENETVLRPEEWNELLVKVEKNRVITRLNGVPMVDFTDPQPKNRDGVIALQIHPGGGARIRFKEIWVRDLAAP